MRPRSNMGYLSGQNQQKGTARGDHALLPCGGAALLGHVHQGPGRVSKSPVVRPPAWQPQFQDELPTYLENNRPLCSLTRN